MTFFLDICNFLNTMRVVVLGSIIISNVLTLIDGAIIDLSPLKCRGFYVTGNKESIPSIFLGRNRLEIFSTDDENEMIVCDVIPIPLMTNNIRDVLYRTFSASSYSLMDTRAGCSVLLNRDKGIFDNLPYESWYKGVNIRREFYNYLSGGQSINIEGQTVKFINIPENCRSPHVAFTYAMNIVLGLNLTGILLEIADETAKGIQLGAAVVIAKSAVADKWTLSDSNTLIPSSDGSSNQEAVVVTCHIDEAVGFALCTGMPIFASRKLFDRVAVDGTLHRERKGSSSYLSITSAAASSSAKASLSTADSVRPAWEIFNPQTFLTMSTREKRATLRASGASVIPRPREGEAALDAALLDLADDSVRLEVLRLRSLQSGGTASTPLQGTTRTQLLLRDMESALQNGDMALAEQLRDKFEELTLLRADSTQAAGSYDPYLDQDEWYLEARRRAMAPKK